MKIYSRILRQSFKVLAILGFFTPAFIHLANAQEMRIFDQTFTATEAEHGFHFFTVDSGCPSNWMEPYNYYEGIFHFRYEIIDYPSTEPFILNACIWSDKEPNGPWRECCPSHFPVPGRGVFTTQTSPSTWWQLHKEKPVDFSRVQDFQRLGIVLWCANGKNLSDWVPEGKGCWSQRQLLLPMKMRVTIVAVAKGYEFSGWK
jgi:hypothetical protein